MPSRLVQTKGGTFFLHSAGARHVLQVVVIEKGDVINGGNGHGQGIAAKEQRVRQRQRVGDRGAHMYICIHICAKRKEEKNRQRLRRWKIKSPSVITACF